MKELMYPNRLSLPSRQPQLAWGLYYEISREALNQTLLEISKNIDNYDPNKNIRAWCNFLLKRRFIDLLQNHRQQGVTRFPQTDEDTPNPTVSTHPDLSNLDRHCERVSGSTRQELNELVAFIQDDPDARFQTTMQYHPHVSFQTIALQRLRDERTWQEISESQQVPLHNLYRFFHTQARRHLSYFQTYLRADSD
jgi:DNA-directed RNA polymerase specialized sigma24 family protein